MTRALRAALDHASTVPFHRDRLGNDSDPWSVLAQTPPMSRSDLQAAREGLLAPFDPRDDWVIRSTTGSTGQPVSVAHDGHSRGIEEKVLGEHVTRFGQDAAWQDRGLMHLVLHPTGRSRAAGSGWSETATATKWNLIRAWQLSDAELCERLTPIAGLVVTGSPSTLELVSDRLADGLVTSAIQPALVVLSGEPVTPAAKEQVGAALGCAVTSVYALGEVGILGTECSDGGYHVEPEVAVVELLDEAGDPAPPGVTGEVTVTTLANRAMPLVRYQTGDRAVELPLCTCGRSDPRIQLTAVRPARWLITEDGTAVHVVRFVKLWRTLRITRAVLRQRPEGGVEAMYWAPEPLSYPEQEIVADSLRSAVGRRTPVAVTWWGEGTGPAAIETATAALQGRAGAEPLPDAPGDIAAWLREELTAPPQPIAYAVITGSSLEPTAGTRFSDIDVTVLVEALGVDTCEWRDLVRRLRARLPRLRMNVEDLAGLAERSPLVLARLCHERLPVLGEMPDALRAGPTAEALARDAATWAHQAHPVLWERLTAPELATADPVHAAYIAQKFLLDACRYQHLLTGGRSTRAADVLVELSALAGDAAVDGREAIEVARELRPPPPDGNGSPDRYLAAAICAVRAISRHRLAWQ